LKPEPVTELERLHMGGRAAIRRSGKGGGQALAALLMLVLVPAMAAAASPKEDETRRDLRDAERLSNEQLAARKEAADRAARAAAETLRLAHERAEAAARLRVAEAATAAVAARIDALAQRRRDAEHRLKARAEAMQPLWPLIERLSLYPAETLLAFVANSGRVPPFSGATTCTGATN